MLLEVKNRIWEDYLMPDRLAELDLLLEYLIDNGYELYSVIDLTKAIESGQLVNKKICMLRVDVDTDPAFCLEFARVFLKYNASASFYFRLCTMKKSTMRALSRSGFEIGYHFEEIATYAKKNKLKSKLAVVSELEEIRSLFIQNLKVFSKVLGYVPKTVASHGDFANRKLGLANSILIDNKVRVQNSLIAETYDKSLVDKTDLNFSDGGPPAHWYPESPYTYVDSNHSNSHVIRILLHPRHWHKNLYWNTRENLTRLIQGLLF